MKVVIGGIAHESNCFVPETMRTTLVKWKRGTTIYGHEKGQAPPEEWFSKTQAAKDFGMRSSQIAFMEVGEEEGIELMPTIFGRCSILPGEGSCWRPLDADLFEWAVGELIKGIKNAGEIDGVLLQGHGAGNSMDFPDMPGELQRRVRQAIGPDIPFIVTTDTHANFGKQMVDNVDVFVGYDTYPHTDGYERAREATHFMAQMIRGEIKPTQALARPNMMPALIPCQSALYPMKHLYDMIHEIEEDSDVITATVAGGFPTSDRPEMGIAVLVTTNNDAELAQKYADRVSGWAWRHRREFLANVMSPEDAIREAIEAPEGPVLMGDPGDSTGCGGTGDGTALLAELIKQGATSAVVAGIRDPMAVEKAIKSGVGKTVTMKIGGKIDNLHGEPVEVRGYIKAITDGKHVGPAMGGGLSVSNWGRTVILDCKGIEIIVTELPCGGGSLSKEQLIKIGIEDKKIICIKSAAHYKAVWKPYAKAFIDPDTPGPGCGSRISGLKWKHLKRPIFPLDAELLGIAEQRKGVYKEITVDSCFL